MPELMRGKRGLIMGVANDHSIAWGIAKTLAAHGAELAFTYQGEALRQAREAARGVGRLATSCCPATSRTSRSVDAVFAEIEEAMGHASISSSTPSASPTRTS